LTGGRSAECGRGYYVLGDYTKDSNDSRYEGPVSPERIIGRPWLRVWPPGRMGFVNP
jgi:type IV secretory pathway protease TraF